MLDRLINLFIRGSSLLSRFILLFIIGIYLKPEDVGLYGLLLSYISYCIYAIGFEFYNYSTREIVNADREQWGWILKNQVVFTSIVYAVVLPLLSLIFIFHLLPFDLILWFYLILVFEHLSHELNRILVAMSKPLWAGFVLFFRTAVWSIIVIILMLGISSQRTLDVILLYWFLGVFTATIIGIIFVIILSKTAVKIPISKKWIFKGIVIALPLLVASLALRGLFSFDKIFIERIGGLDILGPYALFAGVSAAVIAFVDAGIIVFYYPKIIKAAKLNDLVLIKKYNTQLYFQIIILSLFLILCGVIVVKIFLPYFGDKIYEQYIYFLYWQMASVFIYCLGVIPQLTLYGFGKDVIILVSHLLSLAVFFALYILLKDSCGVNAVVIGQFVSFIFMYLMKIIALNYVVLKNIKKG